MKKLTVLFIILMGCGTATQKQDPVETVQQFLIWYETNYKEANAFALVNQGVGVNYSVNFEETEKFLSYLKSSNLVTDAYLNAFRKHFIEAQRFYENEPINEGPPPHFDYDIVLYTQEPDWVFEKRKDLKIISSEIQDENATLNVDVGMKLQIGLSKKDQRWLIDRIDPIE